MPTSFEAFSDEIRELALMGDGLRTGAEQRRRSASRRTRLRALAVTLAGVVAGIAIVAVLA